MSAPLEGPVDLGARDPLTPDPRAFLGRGWAFPVAPAGSDIALAEHDQDIRQAILIILGTGPGERVMRPDFGCGLRRLSFEPLSTTTMTLARHHVEHALVSWEPRIDTVEVTVTPGQEQLGQMLIDVRYRVRTTNTFYNLVYPFYLQEGSP